MVRNDSKKKGREVMFAPQLRQFPIDRPRIAWPAVPCEASRHSDRQRGIVWFQALSFFKSLHRFSRLLQDYVRPSDHVVRQPITRIQLQRCLRVPYSHLVLASAEKDLGGPENEQGHQGIESASRLDGFQSSIVTAML